MKKIGYSVVAVAAIISLAACSSSSKSDTPAGGDGSAAGTTGAGSGSASGGADVAGAQAYVDQVSANPTSLGDSPALTKLPKAPETGKTIVYLTLANPTSTLVSNSMAAAAKSLGWNYKSVPIANTAQGIQQAFESALALNPAPIAIAEAGFPKSAFAPQLAKAKSRNIAVLVDSTTTGDGTGAGIVDLVSSSQNIQRQGMMLGAKAIVDSKGTAKSAIFSVPTYTTTFSLVDGYKAAMAKWCPKCSVKVVPQQVTDIGTTTPKSVASTFQADPDMHYAVFAFGAEAIGVSAALKTAGLTDQVKIMGATADTPNLQALKTGAELAWTGFSAPLIGWMHVNSAVRYSEGLAPVTTEIQTPSQLITKENVGTIVTEDNGASYIGVAGYQDLFKGLWGVS